MAVQAHLCVQVYHNITDSPDFLLQAERLLDEWVNDQVKKIDDKK